MEMFPTANFIDADEAVRLGIVNRVFPDEGLHKETEKIIAKIAEGSGRAMRAAKRAIYQGMRNDLRASRQCWLT